MTDPRAPISDPRPPAGGSRRPTPDPRPPIRVLVVEDSPVVRQFLVHILRSDPDIQVVGAAADGEEALVLVERERPQVITMDINMPRMNGFEATRRIMESYPTPIIIVSGSWDPKEVATSFRALEAGAVAAVARPQGVGHPEFETTARELIKTVKLMSEVRVVRRWPRRKSEAAAPAGEVPKGAVEFRAVAIGASTGGPLVLHTILSSLPRDFPAPMLIVQHIAPGFIGGLVEWLAGSCPFPVHLAKDGEPLLRGHVYVADDGRHMGVRPPDRIFLGREEPENGMRPAVSFLLRSVAEVYGKQAIGILLTGMGKDGARELRMMKDKGAITIVQDKESSIVHGMPGEAIHLDAATHVLPADKIAGTLARLAGNGRAGLQEN